MFSVNRTSPIPPSPLQPQVLRMSAWDPETSFASPGHVVRPPILHTPSHGPMGSRRRNDSLVGSVHSEVLSNDLIQRPANAWLRRYFGSTWATNGSVIEGSSFTPTLDLGADMRLPIDHDRHVSLGSTLPPDQLLGIHNYTHDTPHPSSNFNGIQRFFQTRPSSPASGSPTNMVISTPRLNSRARKRIEKKYKSIKHNSAIRPHLPDQSTWTSNSSIANSKAKTYHASFPTSFPTFSTRDTSHMEFTIGETSPLQIDNARFPTPPLQSERAIDKSPEFNASVTPATALANSPPSSSGNDVLYSIPNYTDVAKLVLPFTDPPFSIATPPSINSTPMLKSSFPIPLPRGSPILDRSSSPIDAFKKPLGFESRFPLLSSTQYAETLSFANSNLATKSSTEQPQSQVIVPSASTDPIQRSKNSQSSKAQPPSEANTTTDKSLTNNNNNNKKLPRIPREPSTHASSKPRVWVQHPALVTKQRPLYATPPPHLRRRAQVSAYPTPTNSSSPQSAAGTDPTSEEPHDPPLATTAITTTTTTTRRQSYRPPAQIRLPIRRISYPVSPPPTQPLPSNVTPFNPSFASLSPFSPLKLKASVYAPTASAMDAKYDSMGIEMRSPKLPLEDGGKDAGEDAGEEGSRRGQGTQEAERDECTDEVS